MSANYRVTLSGYGLRSHIRIFCNKTKTVAKSGIVKIKVVLKKCSNLTLTIQRLGAQPTKKVAFRLFYVVLAQIHPTCLICCSALHFVITTEIFPIIIVFTHNKPQKVRALTTKTDQSKKHYASINSVLPSFKLSKQNLVDKLTIKHTFFGHFTTMKILLQFSILQTR